MQSGCPVLSSNAASLLEVGGEAALYFNPYNYYALINSIKLLLSDVPLQNDLRARGLMHVKNYTWEKAARETLSALLNCL
jgi:glycosyltransferase involved in cell wall biosynthesis